jgi:hypothetical protein
MAFFSVVRNCAIDATPRDGSRDGVAIPLGGIGRYDTEPEAAQQILED